MLKQIEIYGFKSFSERTVLVFEDSINGIVGPNGSGKSNIVDAIKWCLGEQSLKEIRAKSPLDVIFAGSESKSALNWCEVSVVFDNSNRIFPVDYEEVAITRKMYRTGENEYYINRIPCRLKDIKELILDTGLSSDGYSIIPQGKVEFVVSAKPEERRLLFEETAGIAKYKVKREEALRKLERVKLDMARVEDILVYLKEQMASLEQAVRKAKNYQKYKEELQMLECAYAVKQTESLHKKLQEIENLYIELTSKYTQLVTEITQNESEVVELKLNISQKEKELFEIKDKEKEVEKALSVSTQKIETYKTEIIRYEEEINRLKSEIEELNEKINIYSDDILQLGAKKDTILSELNNLQQQRSIYSQEYEVFRTEIGESHSKVAQKNKLLSEISYNKVKIRNEIASLSKNIHIINLEINSLNKEKETNKKQKQNIEIELKEISQQINILENKKVDINKEIDLINKEIENTKKSLNQEETRYEEKNKEFYTLNSKLENLSELSVYGYDSNKLFKILETNNLLDLCFPVSSIIKINPEYYSLVSTYLGNKLFWLVVETEEDAFKIIDLLKANSLGFVTFLIKQKIDTKEIKTTNQEILNLISFEEKYKNIIYFLFSDIEFRDGIIKSDFIIHAGYLEKPQTEDILIIREKLKEISLDLNQIAEKITNLTTTLQNYLDQKASLEKELISVDTQLQQLYKTKAEKEDYLDTTEKLEFALDSEINAKAKESASLQDKLEELNNLLKSLDEEEKNLREEIDSLLFGISKLQSNEVVEKYIEINSRYSKLTQQYDSILEEIKTKNDLIFYNQQKTQALQKEIEEKENLIQLTKEKLEKEEKFLSELIERKKEISSEIEKLINEIESKKNLLQSKEEKLKLLNEEKEHTQQSITSIEIEKTTIQNNIQNISSWLEDKYNISLQDAKQLYGDIKEVDPQTIEKLKKRLDSMSAVNLAAPEEYAQLEEKYNHLVTQQQDLIKAQQDLKEAISKINQQISSNFKETFYKVRENFIKLCGILFEGGKADLILTDENNLLESGIEIMVQPPGKKLQNINLLSGGEKSLVAFALLFAFFMVKPSPVCILDEADAQLDETNVVRFMKLLKDFSKDTKFLLITHNTRTMEFIDTLYGITMEELGVSKVISIKLQKVETSV
ncbi:MAG: AAA family ATPase [Elusimicrobiota bacterium]|nr:AAA family ATPase [Endomicrobiia bacterium]MDW8166141.1 AAA family ATPase [Elusimicrobiota bacterium]